MKDQINIENNRYLPATRWALTSLSVSMLMSSLDTSIANISLPSLAEVFHASIQSVQWVVLAYLLVITTLIVSMGKLGDLIGRKRLLLIGIGLFTVSSVFCGLAPALWLLIASRALQGLGAAMMMALTLAMTGELVHKSKTGSVMGLLGTMSAIGTALGPSLGGFLIAGFGWPSIFFVNVPLGLFNLFLAYRYLPASRKKIVAGQSRFDFAGTFLLGLTLGAYALAMTVGKGHFGRINMVLLLIAIMSCVWFVFTERRVSSPLIRLSLFKNTAFTTSLFTNVLVSTVMMATLVVGPFYLSLGLRLNVAIVGMVMSAGPVISALSGIPAGRIVDRFGAGSMVIVSMIVMMTGLFALSALPGIYGVAGYMASIAILTPGYQLFLASNNTLVMQDVQTEQRGVISGMLSLSRNLGLMSGASVMGAVFAIAAGTNEMIRASAAQVAKGMQVTFLVSGTMMVLAFMIRMPWRSFFKS